MSALPPALSDAARLEALAALDITDTPAEPDYDDLAILAAAVFRSPQAAVNFVDAHRHYTKASAGWPDAQGGSVSNDVSLCASTVAAPDGVLMVSDLHADATWRDHPLVAGGPRVGFYAGVAIHSRGQRVGVVCAFGPEPHAITDAERRALRALARQAEVHVELRRRNAELRSLAVTDALTGLANRTLLLDRLEQALRAAERDDAPVGVLYCDVDDFKAVNDQHGHAAGDRVLCEIAGVLRESVRTADTVARIAGDEFVVVCPGITPAELREVATRLTSVTWPPLEDGTAVPPLSIGALLAAPGDTPASVLRRADEAMYRHKRRDVAAPGARFHRG